jgi:hypothetical protein
VQFLRRAAPGPSLLLTRARIGLMLVSGRDGNQVLAAPETLLARPAEQGGV